MEPSLPNLIVSYSYSLPSSKVFAKKASCPVSKAIESGRTFKLVDRPAKLRGAVVWGHFGRALILIPYSKKAKGESADTSR